MNHSGILEIGILLQEASQICRVDWTLIVRCVQNSFSAVHGYEISEALSEYSVVQNQHAIAGFREGSTCGLKAKDTLAAQDVSPA